MFLHKSKWYYIIRQRQEKVIIETQRVSEETEKKTALCLEGLGSLATFIRAKYLSPTIYVVLD